MPPRGNSPGVQQIESYNSGSNNGHSDNGVTHGVMTRAGQVREEQ